MSGIVPLMTVVLVWPAVANYVRASLFGRILIMVRPGVKL